MKGIFKHTNKSKVMFFCIELIAFLCFFGGVTIVVDPYFHFHPPIDGLVYSFSADPRYINDGISKNWDYNAVITGTSMTQNFKPSEFDQHFGVKSVKMSYEGASFYEIGNNLRKSFDSDNDIKLVLWSLDTGRLGWDANYLDENFNYPQYLTDNCWINDVNYIFNKDVLIKDTLRTIFKTIVRKPYITLDEYNSWDKKYYGKYGKDYVLAQYTRNEKKEMKQRQLSVEEKIAIQRNLEKNIIPLIINNKATTFLFFFPPISIVGLDSYYNTGDIKTLFEKQEYAYTLLSQYENVEVFAWQDNMKLVTDLNNYRDPWHYSGRINSEMLCWIEQKKGILTENNYSDYFKNCKEIFENYCYDNIFR